MKIIKGVILFVCLMFVAPLSCLHAAEPSSIRNAVVKIIVTKDQVDFHQPWQTKGSRPEGGSGCVINGKRILTNAHLVSDYTFIQVRKHNDPKKYTAKVITIGHDCDLALLSVDDEEFFNDVTPLEFGGLPYLQETVNVIGYPRGGNKISITEGVVSRIDITPYNHSSRGLLTVQIDAAINPGNSGGPVIQNGKLVGIPMQVATQSENIGYIIPIPIIKHFFKDLKDGEYDGFPLLGISYNSTENQALKEYYNVPDNENGILITGVLPFSSAEGYLKAGDVVLSLDSTPISEDGTFTFRGTERLSMSYLITDKQEGETLKLKIVRDGEIKNISIPLKAKQYLVPDPYAIQKPSYYVYGGLVFTVLSADLLQEWGKIWKVPLDFAYYRFGGGKFNQKRKEEVVVLLNVLPDEINVGYHTHRNQVVEKVNGQEVKSFKELVAILEQQKGEYTVIETEERGILILENENIDRATKGILTRYNIPTQYSDDVKEWIK